MTADAGQAVQVGQQAPDFELRNQHGETVRLSDARGERHVALVFYPFAFSGTCTGELCEIRDNLAMFETANVQVVGVSCDPMHSLRAFAEAEKYTFPLLSDFWPHGGAAQAYGVFNEKAGMALRGTFLIDAEGNIAFAEVNQPGDAREQSGWKDAVAAL